MSFRLRLLLFALAYWVGAELSYALIEHAGSFSAFWPSVGIYLGMLLATPRRRWWAVVLAAAVPNLLADIVVHGQSFGSSLGFLLVNLGAPLLAAALLVRLCRPAFSFARLAHVVMWTLVVTLVSTPLGAVGGAALIVKANGGEFGQKWFLWWIGDLLGVLALTPLAYGVLSWRTWPAWARVGEAAALLLSLGAATLFVFRLPQFHDLPPVVLYLFLLWAALRFGTPGVAAAGTLLAVIAMWLTGMGFGIFSFQATPHARMLMTQVFVATGALLFYILAAVMAERRTAESELRQSNVRLEEQVQSRTAELTATNQQLRTSEAKFMAAFHNSSLPMAIVSEAEVAYVDVNQACAELFGLPREAMIGRSPAALDLYTDPAQRPLLRAALERDGDVHDFEVNWHAKQGGIRTHLLNADRLTLNGQPCLFVVSHDITERNQAEEKLRRKQAELTDFIENASVGLHWVDADGMILWANRAELELLGYTAEEYIGHSITEFHADADTINDILTRLTGDETLCNYEARLRCKDGSLRDVLINSNVLWEDGKFIHTRCFTRDITERKLTEEKLRQSEERLAAMVNQTMAAMAETDLTGRYTFVNDRYCELTGYTREELIGQTQIQQLAHPEDTLSSATNFRRLIEEGIPFSLEKRYLRKDGSIVWGRNSVALVRDARGQGQAVIAVIVDITERKQAEEKLRESEEDLRLATEAAEMYSWEIDLHDGNIKFADNQAQVLGFALPENHSAAMAFVHPLDRADAERAFDAEIKNTENFETEYRLIHPHTDAAIWVCTTGLVITDAHGTPIRLVGVTQNITSRKEAEEKLRESQERYSAATAAVSDVLWTNNADGLMEGEQRGWEQFTGQSREEYQGYGWSKAVHPEDAQPTIDAWIQAVAEKRTFVFEHRVRRHDGEWRMCSIRAVPVLNANGTIREWVGVHADITEQKRAEGALQASEERFRLAADATHALVYDADYRHGRIAAYGFASLFGTEQIEQITREWYRNQVHPDDLSRLRATLEHAADGNEYNVQYRLRHAEGHYIYVEDNGRLILNDKKEIVRGIGTLMDITERKRAETEREGLLEQEQRARETAEAATRAKDEFLALISHELRNPLNAILGYTQLTRTNPHDVEQVVRHCEIIHRNAKMQHQLIEDLLDTARIISGKLKIEAAPTDLHFVLQEAMTVVLPAAAAKKIDLVSQLGDEPQTIIGDAARLQQVAWNLLQNAIKFTPDGGQVELRLERSEQQVCIIVGDNGKGIEPEFLPAVFDRFSQNDMSRTRRYGGLGLGLALTKQLVELHGGTIEVLSAGLGLGATFTVTLPLLALKSTHYQPPMRAIAEVRTDPEAIPLTDLPRLDNVRVLVVDDQEEARLMVAATLKEWGAIVTTAASGNEARASMNDAEFDVLVCDIAMPGEDGYELIGKIRALENQRGVPHLQRLPAVAVTARARPEDRLQALGAGFQMHITKPVELAELVVVIHSLCNY